MKYIVRRTIVGLPLVYVAVKVIGYFTLFLQIALGEVM